MVNPEVASIPTVLAPVPRSFQCDGTGPVPCDRVTVPSHSSSPSMCTDTLMSMAIELSRMPLPSSSVDASVSSINTMIATVAVTAAIATNHRRARARVTYPHPRKYASTTNTAITTMHTSMTVMVRLPSFIMCHFLFRYPGFEVVPRLRPTEAIELPHLARTAFATVE